MNHDATDRKGKVQLDPLKRQRMGWMISQTDVTTGEKHHSVAFE